MWFLQLLKDDVKGDVYTPPLSFPEFLLENSKGIQNIALKLDCPRMDVIHSGNDEKDSKRKEVSGFVC